MSTCTLPFISPEKKAPRQPPVSKRDEQIISMLPLVRHIAGRLAIHLPSHVSTDDLISAGVVGLIDAVDRFDAGKGSSLKTYCAVRIRGEIVDELRRLDWVPRTVHRDARRLQEAQQTLAQNLGHKPTDADVQHQLGLSEDEYHELLERTRSVHCCSLQEPAQRSDEAEPLMNEEVVTNPDALRADELLLHKEDIALLREEIQHLPAQQVQVLTLFYLEGMRLKEIAEILRVTESRVSQIHTAAVLKLRASFERARAR